MKNGLNDLKLITIKIVGIKFVKICHYLLNNLTNSCFLQVDIFGINAKNLGVNESNGGTKSHLFFSLAIYDFPSPTFDYIN